MYPGGVLARPDHVLIMDRRDLEALVLPDARLHPARRVVPHHGAHPQATDGRDGPAALAFIV